MDGFLEIGKLFFSENSSIHICCRSYRNTLDRVIQKQKKIRPLCKICQLDCFILASYDHDKANCLNYSFLNWGVSPQYLINECSWTIKKYNLKGNNLNYCHYNSMDLLIKNGLLNLLSYGFNQSLHQLNFVT